MIDKYFSDGSRRISNERFGMTDFSETLVSEEQSEKNESASRLEDTFVKYVQADDFSRIRLLQINCLRAAELFTQEEIDILIRSVEGFSSDRGGPEFCTMPFRIEDLSAMLSVSAERPVRMMSTRICQQLTVFELANNLLGFDGSPSLTQQYLASSNLASSTPVVGDQRTDMLRKLWPLHAMVAQIQAGAEGKRDLALVYLVHETTLSLSELSRASVEQFYQSLPGGWPTALSSRGRAAVDAWLKAGLIRSGAVLRNVIVPKPLGSRRGSELARIARHSMRNDDFSRAKRMSPRALENRYLEIGARSS